jgi:hypothetical protein
MTGSTDGLSVTYTVDVAPRKKRVVPKVVLAGPAPTDGDRLLATPGAYALAGTRLRLVASVARPVHQNAPTEPPPQLLFTRAALCMRVCVRARLRVWVCVGGGGRGRREFRAQGCTIVMGSCPLFNASPWPPLVALPSNSLSLPPH